MPIFKDYICPEFADIKWISNILGRRLQKPGEYTLSPVDSQTFDQWADKHPEFKHPLQLSNNVLVVNIMYPPHDGAANAIIQEICFQANFKCHPGRSNLWTRTGLTRLNNGVRKNSDAGIFNHTGARATLFPGVVVECGFSDPLTKSRRDIALWLNNSDLSVKLGIVCKVGVDVNNNINKLIFEFWKFDFTHCTRTFPLGRPKKYMEMDFSGYDGTAQTLPVTTVFTMPSYYLYPDGNYPPTYPLHPNPPALLPAPSNQGRQYTLNQQQLGLLTNHVNLQNNQREPLDIDFRVVADAIRQIVWNV